MVCGCDAEVLDELVVIECLHLLLFEIQNGPR